jgi:hypothetical protein
MKLPEDSFGVDTTHDTRVNFLVTIVSVKVKGGKQIMDMEHSLPVRLCSNQTICTSKQKIPLPSKDCTGKTQRI